MTVTASASDAVAFFNAVLPAFSSILSVLNTPSVSMRPTTSSFLVSASMCQFRDRSSIEGSGLTIDADKERVIDVARCSEEVGIVEEGVAEESLRVGVDEEAILEGAC